MPVYPCSQCGELSPTTTCASCKAGREARRYERTRYTGDPFYQSSAWRKLAAQCKQRDRHTCVVCGSNHRLVAHHKVARKAGGPDTLANLVTLCHRCHNAWEADTKAGQTTLVTTIVANYEA